MQYAIQTRDYKNDYRWSWEEQGREIPLAQISLKLQRLVKDGEKGVAVLASGGTFHVILTAIEKLGKVPLGKDFSGANIRLNLVFSEISQEEAKGLVQYYYRNKADLGNAFPDIISGDANSWKVNDAKLLEAFGNILRGKLTGKKLVCLDGEEKLTNWLDFDMSETDGPKFVLQGDQIMLSVDAMPKPVEGVCPIGEKPIPKKSCMGSVVFFLLLVLLAVATGVLWVDNYNLKNSESKNEENLMKCQKDLDIANTNLADAKGRLKDTETKRANAEDQLTTVNSQLQKTKDQLEETKSQLNFANSTNNKSSINSIITNAEQALKKIEAAVTAARNTNSDNLGTALKEVSNQINTAKTQLKEYKDNADKPEPKQ